MTGTSRDELVLKLGRNPLLAHRALFQHRHPDVSPPFHDEMIRDWHSSIPRLLFMAFRGGAKSTISEEAAIVAACLEKFGNGLFLGESETRAVERLRAVKHEFETNPFIGDLFGVGPGPTWTETKIVLSNGVCLQSHGRGQSLRGIKHLDRRPDLLVGDDMEDEEAVATPEARRKTLRWFMAVVLPALDPGYRARVNATPLDAEALAVKLSNDPGWVTRTYPKKFRDAETGEWRSSWPGRFTIEDIDADEAANLRLGMHTEWVRENMCQAVSDKDRTFTQEMFRTEPLVRTWHPVYAFYDPARTVKATSAHTGKAVWSWIGSRLVVWESDGRLWKPDEIIDDIFKTDTRYTPVALGVEEDGLNEFLLQPLRQAQVMRAQPVPIRAMKAPRGKHDFIRSLQPFFKAGEITFVGEHQELKAQLLGFPTGRIDVPNALAYALKMRPGAPVYESFGTDNIVEGLSAAPREPLWLALNATGYVTAAALVQFANGTFNVLADWLREGSPGEDLPGIVAAAGLIARRTFRGIAPARHFQLYDTVGLRAAARKVPIEISRGGAETVGREEIRSLLTQVRHGMRAFRVSSEATWTLRALSGGYARELNKHGQISDFAAEGPYRVLCEGLESLAALVRAGVAGGDDSTPNYRYTAAGKRYISTLP